MADPAAPTDGSDGYMALLQQLSLQGALGNAPLRSAPTEQTGQTGVVPGTPNPPVMNLNSRYPNGAPHPGATIAVDIDWTLAVASQAVSPHTHDRPRKMGLRRTGDGSHHASRVLNCQLVSMRSCRRQCRVPEPVCTQPFRVHSWSWIAPHPSLDLKQLQSCF